MQILKIVLYNSNQEKRVLKLRPGEVNIITGASATGKSALIEIVNYCLGKKSCSIPEGVIRETVAWYGLLLQFSDEKMFIARQNPPLGVQNTTHMYMERGVNIKIPVNSPSESNINNDEIVELLSRKIGISPNLNTPVAGQTRAPLAANIRHALKYCFQPQDVIAQRNIIFFSQEEPFVSQAIKDTLPYFLGAIREDDLALEQKLALLRRESRNIEKELKESEAIKGRGASKAFSLMEEMKQVGILTTPEKETILLTDEYNKLSEVSEFLRIKCESWKPNLDYIADTTVLTELQFKQNTLHKEFYKKDDAIMAAKNFAQELKGYTTEVVEQSLRLESIGLFKGDNDSSLCPVCNQIHENLTPQAGAIRKSLNALNASLENMVNERPRLREYIETLEKDRIDIKNSISDNENKIKALLTENEKAKEIKDLNSRQARVIGRVSLWLESVILTDDSSGLRNNLEKLQNKIKKIEELLDPIVKEERLTSILNRIGIQMTEWAKKLDLEHSDNPIRFDLKKLTVIADKEDCPIPLYNMGSGENWVGYHLITYLALHQMFKKGCRPVPQFIFFDQPSQVYYPTDKNGGSLAELNDEDRQAINNMFSFIFDVVESLAPDLQVIITDHADLEDSRYQSAIIARWRNGIALIPESWITG